MLLHYDIYNLKTIDGRLHGYISLFLENEQQCNVMKHQNHEQWVLLKSHMPKSKLKKYVTVKYL